MNCRFLLNTHSLLSTLVYTIISKPSTSGFDYDDVSQYAVQVICRDSYGSSDTKSITVVILENQVPTLSNLASKYHVYRVKLSILTRKCHIRLYTCTKAKHSETLAFEILRHYLLEWFYPLKWLENVIIYRINHCTIRIHKSLILPFLDFHKTYF